ncbi:hypothetical protein [Euzebya tangerina]|uniref:hypothetical protein n=1 Tax=Euzebya tangerina TaxID=591198 RepID=UPI0013C3342A|nr:hypothetical protein [Euzebya tangerina]
MSRGLSLLVISILAGFSWSASSPAIAQNNGGSGGQEPPPPNIHSGNTASDIDRVGANDAGILDLNPNVDVSLGGIPCDSGSGACVITAPSDGGASAAAAGGGAGGSPPAPPPPPPPPTHSEIVTQVCPSIPQPAIGVNPREWGVTGVETWLWDSSSRSDQDDGVIRGYPVSCAITPYRWTFDVNEPTAETYGHQEEYEATAAGGEHEDTPVRHMWSTKGTYPIGLTVEWRRETSVDVDPRVVRRATRPYEVREIVIGTVPNPADQ